MADFVLWAAACETAIWPPGTFGRAYEANRRAAIAGIIVPPGRCLRAGDHGRVQLPPTSCGPVRVPAGPKIPARSLAAYGVRRPSSGHWASSLPSVVEAAPASGSSEYEGPSKVPSAAVMDPGSRRTSSPPASEFATTPSSDPCPAIGQVLCQSSRRC
jgi:hypothetical protein